MIYCKDKEAERNEKTDKVIKGLKALSESMVKNQCYACSYAQMTIGSVQTEKGEIK